MSTDGGSADPEGQTSAVADPAADAAADAAALIAALEDGDEAEARRALPLFLEALRSPAEVAEPRLSLTQDGAEALLRAFDRFPDDAAVAQACLFGLVGPLLAGGGPPRCETTAWLLRRLAPPMLAALRHHVQEGSVEPTRDCVMFFATLAGGRPGQRLLLPAAAEMRSALSRHPEDATLAFGCGRFFYYLSELEPAPTGADQRASGATESAEASAATADEEAEAMAAAAAAATEGAVPELLSALGRFPQDMKVALQIAGVFANLITGAVMAAEAAPSVPDGGCPPWAGEAVAGLLCALGEGHDGPGPAPATADAFACAAANCFSVLAVPPEGAALLLAAGAPPALLAALARHPEAGALAASAARLFARLAAHLSVAPAAEWGPLRGAPPPLRAALERHPQAEVSREVAACLASFAVLPALRATVGGEAPALFAAQARHPGDAELACQVALFVAGLAEGGAAPPAAAAAPPLAAALARHPADARLARLAAVALAGLARREDLPLADVQALLEAAPPLLAALARHPGDGPLGNLVVLFASLIACEGGAPRGLLVALVDGATRDPPEGAPLAVAAALCALARADAAACAAAAARLGAVAAAAPGGRALGGALAALWGHLARAGRAPAS